VELGSWFAAIGGICAHMVPPRLARTLMVSTAARVQSSWPCSPSRSSIPSCSASNTPALAHSSRRRHTVPASRSQAHGPGAAAMAWRYGPCRRSRPSSCDPGWCVAGRHTGDGVELGSARRPTATAPPGQAPQQASWSWLGTLPYLPRGAKRGLTIFGRWVLHIRVKFHAARGRRARAA
jgi:hypothetical protein